MASISTRTRSHSHHKHKMVDKGCQTGVDEDVMCDNAAKADKAEAIDDVEREELEAESETETETEDEYESESEGSDEDKTDEAVGEDEVDEEDEDEADADDEDDEEAEAPDRTQDPSLGSLMLILHPGGAMLANGIGPGGGGRCQQPTRSKRGQGMEFHNEEEARFWKQSDPECRKRLKTAEAELKSNAEADTEIPLRFKVMLSDKDPKTKLAIMRRIKQIQSMHEGSGEYHKINNWIEMACRLPIGTYVPMAVNTDTPLPSIYHFLQNARTRLDDTVFGHTEAKDQIIRIMAQWVANPGSRGNCIGIQGPMGVGKSSLVKDGVCKALGLPFNMIALGGASDGSFMEGHSFTYEGSTYGKISEVLMKSRCMNPVIFFDELDKVSDTRRGEEIIGILTHLTDATQNDRFNDRYFTDIDLDLSRALIVFSYNDESKINPILKDRMITIQTKGYATKDKIKIATNYLLDAILKQFNFTTADIQCDECIIEYVIKKITEEQGVRNLKRALESIVSWINMHRFVPEKTGGHVITFPVKITTDMVDKWVRKAQDPCAMNDSVRMMYV